VRSVGSKAAVAGPMTRIEHRIAEFVGIVRTAIDRPLSK
jgi:hypothetical protein